MDSTNNPSPAMRYLPIELDVLDRDALVIGRGAEAASKVDRLLDAGARVTVVTRADDGDGTGGHARPHPILEERAREGRITWLRRAPERSDFDGKVIIFLEPGDDELSRRLFEEGAREGKLVCTLDRPEISTFVNPSVARVSGLTMSFSTGGVSPSVVRRIREDLEALFSDPRFERFLSELRGRRSSLPRGSRGQAMRDVVAGFALEARLHFPPWVKS